MSKLSKLFLTFVCLTTIGCFGMRPIEVTSVANSPAELGVGWDMLKGSYFKPKADPNKKEHCCICLEDTENAAQFNCCSSYACPPCFTKARQGKMECPACRKPLIGSGSIPFKAMLRYGQIEIFEDKSNGKRVITFTVDTKLNGLDIPAIVSNDRQYVAVLFIPRKLIKIYKITKKDLKDQYGHYRGHGQEVAQLQYTETLWIKTMGFNAGASQFALVNETDMVFIFNLPNFDHIKFVPKPKKPIPLIGQPHRHGVVGISPTAKNILLGSLAIGGTLLIGYLFYKFYTGSWSLFPPTQPFLKPAFHSFH